MLLKLAWRNLWRNKMRTGIMLGAMVFGLVGVIAMIAFMTGLMDSMLRNAIAWQTSHIQIHNQGYIDNPDINKDIKDLESLQVELAETSNIEAYSARFIANGMVASARSTRGIRINGIDIDQEQRVTPLSEHIIQGEWLDKASRKPALVSEQTANRLQLKVGSKIVVTFSDHNSDVAGSAFRVKGIFKTPSTNFDDNNLYVRKSDLEKLAGLQGAHEIAIVVGDQEQLTSTLAALQSESSVQNLVRDWKQVQPLLASMTSSMKTSNQVILSIFVLAMGFGIINIMLMSVFERTREFGVLMAVGMQKHKIFVLILLEATLLGLCGATLGVGLCILLVELIGQHGFSLGAMADGLGSFGIDTQIYPSVATDDYVMAVVAVILASTIAAIYPAFQILKKHPAQAMAEKH
ncbi:FtsX-like permease family protein [Vibrio sp. SCSIO 43136]|uniref:ABC transporter permease n=1 Tax=Vibrio sp. SCSIO 43136 TaxID=2819101 RepID=UPI0020753E42|nr:FtsX-like permease family protein [Vibrio sp. SCSIO 43136]USD64008.1 ABC transporter permease [Vibrio sp. SCSIO 43136]